MAVIPGVIAYPGISADRAARTIIASWTGAADINSPSTVVSLMHRHNGLLADSFVVDVVTTLNSGTVTGGAIKVDLSWDGVHWVDSQVPAVTISASDDTAIVLPVSLYVAPAAGKLPYLPARFARVQLSTAVTVTGAPSFEMGFTLR